MGRFKRSKLKKKTTEDKPFSWISIEEWNFHKKFIAYQLKKQYPYIFIS